MKTLIFNGSPRKNGDTAALITSFLRETAGYPDDTYKIVTAYDAGIQPCRDCRYCRNHPGCSIQDSMEDIYAYIQECDNILIASPLYFSQLTGPLLCVASRLQTYWSARFFRHESPIAKPKKGAVLLAGGGDGSMDGAYDTACTLLHHMYAVDIYPLVFSHHTNDIPAKEDSRALEGITEIVSFFHSKA